MLAPDFLTGNEFGAARHQLAEDGAGGIAFGTGTFPAWRTDHFEFGAAHRQAEFIH